MQLGELGERFRICNVARKIRNGRISLADMDWEQDILDGLNSLISIAEMCYL